MSDLEARIAEVLAVHAAKRPWSDAGVMRCSCTERFVAEFVHQQNALHRTHLAAMLAPVIREAQAEALEAFGHMHLNPEQDENYNKTARAGRGYYRALIETRAKRIRSNDE